MIWVGVVLVTVVAVFAFLQPPFRQVSTDLLRTTRKSLHIISSRRISDHWKARVLPRYAGQMFKSSLILLFCLLVLIFPVIAGDWIASLWSLDLVAAIGQRPTIRPPSEDPALRSAVHPGHGGGAICPRSMANGQSRSVDRNRPTRLRQWPRTVWNDGANAVLV